MTEDQLENDHGIGAAISIMLSDGVDVDDEDTRKLDRFKDQARSLVLSLVTLVAEDDERLEEKFLQSRFLSCN